ncbi:coumaroyl-CoA:anthocyanidin 3-O-glucoside-6''-O-coumaroyltransferase 1-like [Abrus precatorius]|uniref:Coumaroyl-CoA:anthocyanidin 3-O-glucoside-6''-O-coumaroyltransferase 1-like n=1 Tax=Abrus precatorius TaxID=3816 RepID=A0A8B8KK19_ABRPR|nr:coumaroyl-CoA:anthocyanidin 3-O-glucoside-6''-O-coumaroyltransferase 1-like [Abrus precatorius]
MVLAESAASLSSFQNQSTSMAKDIIDDSQVSPPPHSVTPTILPLTFLDLQWFFSRHATRIFFYQFPHPTQHFLKTALPILKHSLSLTLQHFFPFASNLIVPPQPRFPYIRYLDGDSLSFTVAESVADFTTLTSDSPQDVNDWQPLVPVLPSPRTMHDGTCEFPLMAIKVTVIPNSGFSICVIFNHVAGDGRTLHHFMKFWASVCKSKGDLASLQAFGSLSLPFHDRDIVNDPKGLKLIYLQDMRNLMSQSTQFAGILRRVSADKVRANLTFDREQAERMKRWVYLKCNNNSHGSSGTLHISTFVVTCSLMWVCMIKSELKEKEGSYVTEEYYDEPCNLAFSADCHDHPQFLLPSNYFGNCLVPLVTSVKRSALEGENGVIVAAKAIERMIRGFKIDALSGAETVMSDFRELVKSGQSLVVIVGSPKLTAYNTDFGWGKPRKSEVVNLDSVGTISLTDCRDTQGGVQVGIALERIRMTNFTNIMEQQLSNIAVRD